MHTTTATNLPINNQYPKLVRDRIPEIIEREGKTAATHIANHDEYVDFLLAKLIEKADERGGFEKRIIMDSKPE